MQQRKLQQKNMVTFASLMASRRPRSPKDGALVHASGLKPPRMETTCQNQCLATRPQTQFGGKSMSRTKRLREEVHKFLAERGRANTVEVLIISTSDSVGEQQ